MSVLLDPSLCAQIERMYSPLFNYGISSPEVGEEFDRLGVEQGTRYFATRVAPIGAVPAPVVASTFYNFNPELVGLFVPAAWERFTPAQLIEAQRVGVTRSMARVLADVDPGTVIEIVGLLQTAVTAAARHSEGRPLFAATAALAWPEDPGTALWQTHCALREFRGDGHIAVLMTERLSGLEAVILHIAVMARLTRFFKATRGWSDEQWAGGIQTLRADGWLTADEDVTLTPQGSARRAAIEQRTNELNVPAYEVLGEAGCLRLLELGEPISQMITEAGGDRFIRTLLPSI